MSLLDNASLVLTPNAYKEGKLYSVIPSNGNGDFTATRATTATRVNAAGLVELVPYNLLQRSEEFENAAWPKVNSSVSANTTTAPNGTLTADSLTPNATLDQHRIDQTPTSNAGAQTFSIYAKANGYGFVGLRIGLVGAMYNLTTGATSNISAGFTASTENIGDGWFRCILTKTSGATNDICRVNVSDGTSQAPNFSGNGTDGIFLWGAQLAEGTSARDYLRTETRLNIPRVDYSLGGCPNLLLEPQRTNLVLQSSSFDNADWIKTQVTVTENATTSPDGTQNADKLIDNATNSAHKVGKSLTPSISTTYAFSCFVKKAELNYVIISSGGSALTGAGGSGADRVASINLTNGQVVTNNYNISSVDYGNGWYRVTILLTTDNDGGSLGPYIAASQDGINASYIGSGQGIYLWGAQLEAGAYATSYIPTTTASVTRNADSITRNNIFTNGLITAAGGTWFVEIRNNRNLVRDGFSDGLWLRTAVGQDGFKIRNTVSSSVFLVVERLVAGVSTNLYTIPTSTAKVAIKWNGSTADVFVNGVKVVTSTAFTATNMEILNGFAADVPKYINEMALFPTPLTDAQCLALTA